jgi:hypothetical protein
MISLLMRALNIIFRSPPIEDTMKAPHQPGNNPVEQQISLLEQDYVAALRQGKEFEILKQIRLQIKMLKEGKSSN